MPNDDLFNPRGHKTAANSVAAQAVQDGNANAAEIAASYRPVNRGPQYPPGVKTTAVNGTEVVKGD